MHARLIGLQVVLNVSRQRFHKDICGLRLAPSLVRWIDQVIKIIITCHILYTILPFSQIV